MLCSVSFYNAKMYCDFHWNLLVFSAKNRSKYTPDFAIKQVAASSFLLYLDVAYAACMSHSWVQSDIDAESKLCKR